MKKFILIYFFSLFAQISYADCDLPFPSKWIEQKFNMMDNSLILNVPNDRNIYFYYKIGTTGESVFLAHHRYVCQGKMFYLVTEDETIELFAYIGLTERPDQINLHMVKNQQIQGIVSFTNYPE